MADRPTSIPSPPEPLTPRWTAVSGDLAGEPTGHGSTPEAALEQAVAAASIPRSSVLLEGPDATGQWLVVNALGEHQVVRGMVFEE